jgi:glycosyltransferase involved in cell wall biosynthesis
MRILHVTQGYHPAIGGTEFLIQRVSEELKNKWGDEVTIFTTNCYSGEAFFNPKLQRMATGWSEHNGVKIYRFPVKSHISRFFRIPQAIAYRLHVPGNQYLRLISSGPIIPGLKKAIKNYPTDIISAASFPLTHMFTAQRAANETRRSCIFTGCIHPMDNWGFDRQMIYKAINQANHYIALTNYEVQYLNYKGVDKEKITVIGAGVDIEPYNQINNRVARKELGIEEGPVVGFIGQIAEAKGVGTLMKSMKSIWKELPNTNLLIAGAKTLYCDKLEKDIAKLPENYQKKVFIKYNFSTEEKADLFAAIDLLAYPSGFESFGIAFLEAWAAEKPVIGCNQGAVPWVIEPGIDGLVVDYLDHLGLTGALLLLLKNPSWAKSLGEIGKKKVLENYTWSKIASRYRDIYIEYSNSKQK